jgi:hypothetical protein
MKTLAEFRAHRDAHLAALTPGQLRAIVADIYATLDIPKWDSETIEHVSHVLTDSGFRFLPADEYPDTDE